MSNKTQTAKRLHFRKLASGKISVGEYIGPTWHNVISPFKPTDLRAIQSLKQCIAHYNAKAQRDVEFVAYGSMTEAEFMEVLNAE